MLASAAAVSANTPWKKVAKSVKHEYGDKKEEEEKDELHYAGLLSCKYATSLL